MPVELPAVVIESDAPTTARSLATLDERARRALAAYGEATALRATDLPEDGALAGIAVDPGRGARILRIEEALRAARGPLDLGDRDAIPTVRASVAAAYADARAHPEDPEAPFLVAEALRTLARVEDLAGDTLGARALRRRADLLDGGRRIGLSEGGPDARVAESSVPLTLTLLDASTATSVFVDGELRPADAPLALEPGEHHLRVTSGTTTLGARWITVAGPESLTLRGGAPRTPCSARDLAPALGAMAKDATFAITCPRWLRVVPRATAVEIRVCSATSCGAPTTWSTVPLETPSTPKPTSVWSSRWTWIGIGAAAVAGGALTAWRLGAFDRDDPPPPAWRWEGAR